MMMPELTLQKAREAVKVKAARASDFLTKEELDEVHESNAQGKKNTGYDAIDAYIAEIIARFGYDVYKAWNEGLISETRMAKYIKAERAREVRSRLMIENVIVAAVSGANHPTKTGHAPKSLKTAIKMLKSEQKLAQGGK